MKALISTVCYLILFLSHIEFCFSSGDATTAKPRQGPHNLNSRNFETLVSDGNVWLIEFYAPWCGHCQRFAPAYETVATTLHSMHEGNDRKVMVGKIDGASERALSSRFNVKGFPSFYLIDGWTVRQYEGERSVGGLVKFATETYISVEPIPFIYSPFGPMGQLRGYLMYGGSKILDIYDYLVKVKGFSSLIAWWILSVIVLTIGVFMIITIGLITIPRDKQD